MYPTIFLPTLRNRLDDNSDTYPRRVENLLTGKLFSLFV